MVAQQISFYDTVSDMVADSDLAKGDRVQTSGYYAIEDSGATRYVISDSEGSYQAIKLVNGLYADPQLGNTINLQQLGLKDGGDITSYIELVSIFPDREI